MKCSLPSPCCRPAAAERLSEDGRDTRLPASIQLTEGTRLSPARARCWPFSSPRSRCLQTPSEAEPPTPPVLCLGWGRSGSPPPPPPPPEQSPAWERGGPGGVSSAAVERHSSGAKRRLTPTAPRSRGVAQARGAVTALKPRLPGGGRELPWFVPLGPTCGFSDP